MTREEKKKQKRKEEEDFVKSLFGKRLTSVLKNKFRETFIWKDFRNGLKQKRKVDFFTGRKLTKTWNCHHRRTDSRLYTDLNEDYYLALNNQMHSLYHICYEEMRKDPKFLRRIEEQILIDLKLNDNESFIHKKKS